MNSVGENKDYSNRIYFPTKTGQDYAMWTNSKMRPFKVKEKVWGIIDIGYYALIE